MKHEFNFEEPFIESYTDYDFDNEIFKLDDFLEYENTDEVVKCGKWPKKNSLLPGLAKINRKHGPYKELYKRWVRHSHDAIKHIGSAAHFGMSKKSFDSRIEKLRRLDCFKGWEKVELALIKHGHQGPPPGIRKIPTAGFYYQRKYGDTMSKIGRGAYKNRIGASIWRRDWRKYLKGINCHPYNRRYWVRITNVNNKNLFGDQAISRKKIWENDLVRLNKKDIDHFPTQSAPSGDSRPLIFIPLPDEIERFACRSFLF